jgi:PAS domain S-box-containing protein
LAQVLALLGWMGCAMGAMAAESAEILVIHSYHPEYPWTAAQAGGINDGLTASNSVVHWHSEYLDARRTPFPQVEDQFEALLEAKHRGRRFAAVIATDRRAVQFIDRHRARLAPDAQMVFSGISKSEYGMLGRLPAWSGVFENYDVGGTVDLVRALLPGTRHLLVVYNEPNPASGSLVDGPWFNQSLAEHALGMEVTRFRGFSFQELFERAALHSENTVVLVDGVTEDRDGGDFSPERVRELGRRARLPLFTSHGEVFDQAGIGGVVTSGRESGMLAARLALERMASPGGPPVFRETPMMPVIRFAELARWGIPEDRVPAGTVVLDRTTGLLGRYGWEIASAGVLFVGLVVSVAMLSRSVRQRRTALVRVSDSERLYRSLIEQSPDAVFLIEGAGPSAGTILSANGAGAALHGFSSAEMTGMRIQDVQTPETTVLVERHLDRLLSGKTLSLRAEHVHRDRSTFPMEVNARVIRLDGRPCVLCIGRDVRLRDRQEHRFRELAGQVAAKSGEEFLRAVVAFVAREFSMAYVGITLRDPEGSGLLATRSAILKGRTDVAFCYRPEGTPCAEVVEGRTVLVASNLTRAYPKDEFFRLEALDSYAGVPLREADGRILGMIACAGLQPIEAPVGDEILAVLQVLAHSVTTEILQIEAQRRLELSELHHRQIIENSPVGIVIVQDDLVAYSNPAAGGMAAVPGEVSLMGRPVVEFVAAADQETLAVVLRRVMEGEPVPASTEVRLQRLDGDTVPIEVRAVRTSFNGRPAVAALITDLSERVHADHERRRMEFQLRQAQKLEAVGTLTGGIAHDFNNMLTAILGNLELAERSLPEGSAGREHMAAVRGPADRARTLVARMLAFARQGESRRAPVDLPRLVLEMSDLMRPMIPSSVEVRHAFEEPIPSVHADATQLHQVLLNLCGNAVQAMDGRNGVLEIGLCCRNVAPAEAQELEIRAGPHVELRVRDTGVGMDAATQERIFEPFFTTKPAGQGTGLGLAMVHGTVVGHQGAVRVTSSVGRGSTFRILLPVSIEPYVWEPEPATPEPGSGERILVVDDEPAVALVAVRFLEKFGYAAVSCTDPRQAPTMIAQAVPPFDAVISDLTMPHWNGIALLAEIRRIDPGIPVLLSSGYSGTLTEEGALKAGFGGLLHKPYSLNAMARAVRAILVAHGDPERSLRA